MPSDGRRFGTRCNSLSRQVFGLLGGAVVLALGGCASLAQPPAEPWALLPSEGPAARHGTTAAVDVEERNFLKSTQQNGDSALDAVPLRLAMRSPGESSLDFNARAFEYRLSALFQIARRLVESETDTALDHVQLQLVDDGRINDEVEHETRRLTHGQFSQLAFADAFLEQVMRNQRGTYAALYASDEKAILVSQSLLQQFLDEVQRHERSQEQSMLALLIHELVHAADDVRYHIHDDRVLNFRASFAQSAVYEGHAQFLTRRICAEHHCTEGLNALDRFMFGESQDLARITQSVQAVSRNVLEYSYVEGENFISTLASRPDADIQLDAVLRQPPLDPIQILDPGSYPDTARWQANRALLEASAAIDHPWMRSPWARVETSPLKGVNLRADPNRRAAAVDGFTRLIQAMVGLQHYDQQHHGAPPVEVLLFRTADAQTAGLFAQSLSLNLPTQSGVERADAEATIRFRHLILRDDGNPWSTLIAAEGPYVAQINGSFGEWALAEQYAAELFSALEASGAGDTLALSRLHKPEGRRLK